ncbi:MAG: hypothetical protein M3069_15140 [Chloroflexota bacterium]|nr:hypothetical protein [Chloroflexota bacterium]
MMMARHTWLLSALGLVLLLGELPLALSVCCAPAGATGLGTAWFVNDFAQYESAMRQGAEQSGWLIHDAFTAEPHQAAFMFPLYVGVGKLASSLGVPASRVEHTLEVLARAALVLALWRFARSFAASHAAARWTFALALFGSGFELFAAVSGGAIYTGNWSYESNGFGLLFAAPHVPLGMAATLELARGVLRPRPSVSAAWLVWVALLSAAIALLHPFHLPVLLGAAMLAGLVFRLTARGAANLVGGLVACLAALPILWLTVATFSFDPFWVATYSSQNRLPSPAPHELLIDLGPVLLLAIGGAVMLRGRVAPFGLLLWLLLALVAMYLPVAYQRRLSFGSQPALAVLAANALMAACGLLRDRRATMLRLGVVATAVTGTLLILVSIVASGFKNTPLPIYRSTGDLDAAAAWLDTQAQPGDVILADWQASNYLAPRTPAHVFGGHPVATLQATYKEFATRSLFAHTSSLLVARQLGAQWLVYGPDEANLAGPDGPAFRFGVVRVYRVGPG